MPDPTIHTIKYHTAAPTGGNLFRCKTTWSAWSSTHPYHKGYGTTEEEAVADLTDNIQKEGGDQDAE